MMPVTGDGDHGRWHALMLLATAMMIVVLWPVSSERPTPIALDGYRDDDDVAGIVDQPSAQAR